MKHFRISLLCGIIWHLLRSNCETGECPSGYQLCGRAAPVTDCVIPSNYKEGYVAYGASDKWALTPFTNDEDTQLKISCDDYLGSPVAGPKVCCYIGMTTGVQGQYSGIMNEAERVYYDFKDLMTHRLGYGANGGQYLYRFVDNAPGYCHYTVFGLFAYGVVKDCNYKSGAHPIALYKEEDWKDCGSEATGTCDGLSNFGAQWIRYGVLDDGGKFWYRLVLGTAGAISCGDAMFGGRPQNVKVNICWRSPADFHFTDITGSWETVPTCQGCETNKWTVTQSVTHTTTFQTTEEWAESLQASASETMVFEGGTGTVTLTATLSHSLTESQLTTDTLTTTTSYERECAKPFFWQYITSATQGDGFSSNVFKVKSAWTLCSPSSKKPACPAGYCLIDDTHKDCQNCTEQYKEEMINLQSLYDYIDEPMVRYSNTTIISTTDTIITTDTYYDASTTLDEMSDNAFQRVPHSWMPFLIYYLMYILFNSCR